MYSKNDYRYYLENQLIHSDDFLAHYGVKGMKWKHHKKLSNSLLNNMEIAMYDTAIIGKSNSTPAKARNEKRKHSLNNTYDANYKGRMRTKQFKGESSEYSRESEYNSKKNNFPSSTLKSKKQKVEVTELKNTKTGEKYKTSKSPSKKSKNPLAPKNQKVEIITDKKKKRTKKEAKWNKEMQNYGKEILAEQNKKKR